MSQVIRYFQLVLFAGLAAACVGCSTDPVYNTPAEDGTAWWAYQQCLARLSPTANPARCNTVGVTSGVSYTDYSLGRSNYNNPYQPTGSIFTNSGYKAARPVTDKQLADAYRAYVESLDPATQQQLAEQWMSL